MARNPLAIRKGMSAEYLAKAHFSKQGYFILSPDSHETSYDFIAMKNEEFLRIQVKCILELKGGYARVRNKHGSKNRAYLKTDYDVLAGVWVKHNKIYLFKSEDINENSFGEALTVAKLNGAILRGKRPLPYYEGDI